MSASDLVNIYVAAWNEPDNDRRRQLLEQAWTDEGTYTDPQSSAAGRDAFVALIGAFMQRFQGVRLERRSNVDKHHGLLRFAWSMVGPGGPVMEGMDFGELAEDGRLCRIIGFFGPLASRS
jgi:SnoaL-like domain